MSFRFCGWLLAVFCCFPTTTRADFWLKPQLGTQLGTTDFDLQLEQEDATGDVKVRSLLEWPVDVWLAGLSAGTAFPSRKLEGTWVLEGRFDTSLGDARGKMVDRDWLSSRSENIPSTLFAKTESNTESFVALGELSAGYRFHHRGDNERLTIDAHGGMRLEYFAMTALGAKGKYLDRNGDFQPVEIAGDIDAAVYKVVHVLPFVGSQLVLRPIPRLSFPLTARVHALLSYSHDDHVLRNKDAYGRAYGMGLSSSIASEYAVSGPLALGLYAEAYYLASLTGILKQEFYDDDPGTPTDERDSQVPDSDFAVKSVRLQLMVYARLTF